MEQAPPGGMGIQLVNQLQPQQQPLQALMQSQIQLQPHIQQQQQQQLVSPHAQNNPQQPLQMQQAPPQPLLQNFRVAEAQGPPVIAPKPLLGQPIGGPNVGGQPGDGHVVPGVEASFDRHGQQVGPSGPVGLVGPGNAQRSEYQMPRPVSGPVPQQGHQLRQPAGVFQTNQVLYMVQYLVPVIIFSLTEFTF